MIKKLKSLLTVVLTLCLGVPTLSMGMKVEASQVLNGYTYEIVETDKEKYVALIDADNTIKGDVVVPSQMNGYIVREIRREVFSWNDNITSVVIPETISIVEAGSFTVCENLEKVTFKNTMEVLSDSMFEGCENLSEVVLPQGLRTIEDYAFHYCPKLEKIELSETLDSIGEYAFASCESLKEVVIPQFVTSIKECAFVGCLNLESATVLNKDCEIECFEVFEPTTILYGWKNSTLEYLASSFGFKFVALDTEQSESDTLVGKPQLSLEENGTTKFNLRWTKVNGANRYIIYRKSKTENWKKVLTLKGNVRSYTTSSLVPNTYTFQVKAARGDGAQRIMSKGSNTKTGTTTFNKPSVTLTANQNQIKVSWKAVEGIDKYEVYKATSKNGTYKKIKTTAETSYTSKNLKTGKTYYYKVRGYKGTKTGKVYTQDSTVKYTKAK